MATQSTRTLIVETADTLFYEGGFAATSFADIAAVVGISRGNFYHHFKSKDDILDAVIDHRIARTAAMLTEWEADCHSPRDRIAAFVNIVIVNQSKIMTFGCPVGTLCAELAKLDHVAKGRAAAIFGLYRDWLASQFSALGVEGTQDMALHVLGWSQGVAAMATAFQDQAYVRREVDAITDWLDSLTLPTHQI